MKFALATSNLGKAAELIELLELPEVVTLGEFAGYAPPAEDGDTFEANAEIKARALSEYTGMPALADDSGICVDALQGGPGVYSARYAAGSDADRVRALLDALEGIPPGRRAAKFCCALCVWVPGRGPLLASGECKGDIALAPRGKQGFGYDSIFVVPAAGRTFAELSRAEKHRYSHRAAAARVLLPRLRELSGLQAREG